MSADTNQERLGEPTETPMESSGDIATRDAGKKLPYTPGDAKLDAHQGPRSEHYSGTVFGPIGDHSTNSYHFGKTQERLEEILHSSDAIPPHEAYPNEEIVHSFAKALVEQHVLLVTHPIRARKEVQSALYSLLEHLRGTHAHLRRFTSNNLKPPELKLFTNADKTWTKALGDSIVYLDLRDHPDNLTFEFTESLCRELSEAHCHLVLISVREPSTRPVHVETLHVRAKVPEWHIEPDPARTAEVEDIKLDLTDPVTQTLVFAASMAPGLPAASFVRLCDQLLPSPEAIRARPAASSISDGDTSTEQACATPLQRWYAGERDVLLRNAGVKLALAGDTVPGHHTDGLKGFYVENPDTSIQAKTQLFTEAPLFLVDKFGPMTRLYFEEQWPDTFCDGYIDFACRLHALGLHLLSGAWLTERFAAIESGQDPDYGLRQLARLVYRLADLPKGPDLIADFYRRIADQIRDEEESWHQKLVATPLTNLTAAVASCLPVTGDHNDGKIPESAACVIRYRHEHGLDGDFFALLHRACFRFVAVLHVAETLHDSASALKGLQRALVGPESRQRLRQDVGDLPDVNALISPVNGAFQQAADILVRELPDRFLALTGGILEQLPLWGESTSSRSGTSASNGDNESRKRTRLSVAAAEIASDAFLEAFERFLSMHLPKGLSDGFVDSVLAPDQGRRCGQIVFAMMNRHQPRTPHERLLTNPQAYPLESRRAIRVIEWLCRGLLRRKGRKESSVLPYAIGFGSQIRWQLKPSQLAEVIDEAHQYESDFSTRADIYRMLEMHEDETRELQRARLLGMVIRGLTTHTPSHSGDRKA